MVQKKKTIQKILIYLIILFMNTDIWKYVAVESSHYLQVLTKKAPPT